MVWFIFGLVTGCFMGIIMMAILVAAKDGEAYREVYRPQTPLNGKIKPPPPSVAGTEKNDDNDEQGGE